LCAGSSFSFVPSGGGIFATYSLNPGNTVSIGQMTITPPGTTQYTLTGTTAVGCSITPAVADVTVQTINTTVTPPTQTVCAGVTVTLTANSTAGGFSITPITHEWFDPAPIGTSTIQTATPTVTSTYTVVSSINGCTAEATATAVIGPSLSILASATSSSVCDQETFILNSSSSATNVVWTRIAPLPPILPAYSATGAIVSATGGGTFVVTGSNGLCVGSETVVVARVPFTPSLSASSISVCPGEPFSLIGSGGATANSYLFGIVNPLTFTVTPINIVPGSATISVSQTSVTMYGVTTTNSNTCQGSETLTVFMSPTITPGLSASSVSVCASTPVTLTATGGTLYTFSSSTSGPISGPSTSSTAVNSPASATIYSVVVTDPSGFCTASATLAVNMLTIGNLTLTLTSSAPVLCVGQTASLAAFGALNYTWVTGSNNSTIAVTPTTTTSYSVLGSNSISGGCFGTSAITISVDPIPSISASANFPSVCAGFTSTLTATGANSYSWTGNTFPNAVLQQSVSVSPGGPNAPGSYTVVGFSQNGNCPSNVFIVPVTQSPPLNITTSITPQQGTTCIVQNYPYKISKPVDLRAFGAQTYAWFPYNATFMTYPVGALTTVRPPATTCYTVTGATPVCTGTAVVCVNVVPQFTMNVTPPLPAICIKDSIKLSIQNINSAGLAPYTYNWGDPPNSPPPSITSQTSLSLTAFPQSTSTYTVEVTDARSCVSLPRLVTVTVLPRPITNVAIPIINGVPTHTVCFVGDRPGAPDNKLDLKATNQNLNLPFGVTATYTWISPYSPSSIITSSNTPLITTIAPKRLPTLVTFSVISGYNGIPGCREIDTVTLRIIDCRPLINSIVTFTTDVPKNDILCARDCISYQAGTDTLAGGPQTYSWTFTGGSPATSNLRNPIVCYDLPNPAGWDVVLKVSNPYPILDGINGGSVAYKSSYQYIKVVDYPNVTIVPPGQLKSDTMVKFGRSIVLTASNAQTYTWSPQLNISARNGSVVTVNPLRTQQYIVTGSNGNRCFSSDTINVIVINDCGDMFVPNAFSPNGDGVNDELTVNGVCLETLTFMIFNRWGEKVFETNDVKIGWDGTFHGEKVNTGVFFYRLEGKSYDGNGYSSKGNITLIR